MIESAVDLQKASEITATAISTLRRKIKDGDLKARKHGARVVILRSDLDEYLQNLPVWTPGEAPAAANAARRSSK